MKHFEFNLKFFFFCYLKIDPTSIENINPKQKLEDNEWSLQVLKIPLDNLYDTLQSQNIFY